MEDGSDWNDVDYNATADDVDYSHNATADDDEAWQAELAGLIAFSKTIAIIRSSSAIISLVSSSILIWILNRSNERFSSIYHRILLGMSFGDILMSFSLALFNLPVPYFYYHVWNARGNVATCLAQGFIWSLGFNIGLCYTCSLILYSLAVVKYKKRDSYIRKKIEPFLHGVPIAMGIIIATIALVGGNFDTNLDETCFITDKSWLLYFLNISGTLIAVPIITGVSLCMIYRAVKRQELANARYGAGALAAANANTHQTASGTNSDEDERTNHRSIFDQLGTRIRSGVSSLKNARSRRGQSSSVSNSRVVMRRAIAFTISYFLTWTWYFVAMLGLYFAGGVPDAILYLSVIFNPLQGFFNLCIFLQPTVLKIKSRAGNDKTWCQAVMEAIRYNGRGDRSPGRGEGRGGGHANRAREQEPKRSHTQRMSLEAQEDVQESPGADGPHDSNVPSDGAIAQIDTVEP